MVARNNFVLPFPYEEMEKISSTSEGYYEFGKLGEFWRSVQHLAEDPNIQNSQMKSKLPHNNRINKTSLNQIKFIK